MVDNQREGDLNSPGRRIPGKPSFINSKGEIAPTNFIIVDPGSPEFSSK
jgi:hypothetical protein